MTPARLTMPRQTQHARRRLLLTQGLLGPPPSDVETSASESTDWELRFAPVRETAGLVTIRRLLASPHPVVWVFTGDNLAQGAVYTDGARGFVEHFAERVRSELRRVLDLVINTGISGDTARGLLKLYKFRSLRFRPDVVSLCVGMNDAKAGKSGRSAFRRDLRDLLDRTRTIGAVPVLHSPNAIDPQSVFNRADLPGYVQILREEAERFDVPLIDHYRHWKHLALPGDGWRGWLADGRIQPDGSGHRELARLLFHDFGIFDPRSPTCTGNA